MSTLAKELRKQLENTVLKAREEAERGAAAALESYGVGEAKKPTHLDKAGEDLRKKLRARGRQAGDLRRPDDSQEVGHLVQECAYEHWHRMLFARFLAENGLLIEPESGLDVDLDYCEEQARESKSDKWEVAASFAQRMLTGVFRLDDPVLQLRLPTEFRNRLTALLASLPSEVFTASDSLGWTYQFWQTKRKKDVNESGVKIGADEISPVTQLFTEDYMVDFLLDNTLGAWHAGKVLAANPKLAETSQSEDELRQAVALPGCPWKYLRFIKGEDGKWTPAAGTFDGWPKTAAALRALDPCMGSGHFVVAIFERLVAMRRAEENMDEAAAMAAVIRDNLFGLEIDPRCTQIGAFNLALAAWRRVGHCKLPAMNLACSGLAPNTREGDWLAIAGDNEKLQSGMKRLYRLFQKAAVLGSLINPRYGDGNLLVAGFQELQPLLEKALTQDGKDDAAHEMAVIARGLAKAAEILAGKFTLVATNVPFLGRGDHTLELKEFLEEYYPESKTDLATAQMERAFNSVPEKGTIALVVPQIWLSYTEYYKDLRQKILLQDKWHLLAPLGKRAFRSIDGEAVDVALIVISKCHQPNNSFAFIDATNCKSVDAKTEFLTKIEIVTRSQQSCLKNAGFVPLVGTRSQADHQFSQLSEYVTTYEGISRGDTAQFDRYFWELPYIDTQVWAPLISSSKDESIYGGASSVFFWENGEGVLADFDNARVQGTDAWGKQAVFVSRTHLNVHLTNGAAHSQNGVAILPNTDSDLPAILSFCSSELFRKHILKLNQKLIKPTGVMDKVPFQADEWRRTAQKQFPTGIPKPHSTDPKQWFFNGSPKGSRQPLHVAVARLLGYRWPRQTGLILPGCSAISNDGLEKYADADGIVCLRQVRKEEPAALRLRVLLADAYGDEWSHEQERKLIAASGSNAESLEEWLLNDFFRQHCNLFNNRPFIWHIWDGRKDGFNALVNYHKLAGPNGEAKRTLENLTYAYLGEWIGRQKHSVANGLAGADERLAFALELQFKFGEILNGEPPYDLFVRWKPIERQSVGWNPEICDGVRVNIRPFLMPGGKRAIQNFSILRYKPNINWAKDKGRAPNGEKNAFPWFWRWDSVQKDFVGGTRFDGIRWNTCHYTNSFKRSKAVS